jgi:hypothetical protein
VSERNLAAYKSATRSLMSAVESLVGDKIEAVVSSRVDGFCDAELHLDAEHFTTVRGRLSGVTLLRRTDSGPWSIDATFGRVKVVALYYDRPSWLPEETTSTEGGAS